ncbi:hypothetical protein IWZ03DRAFT_113611 [Phyllosticta citriasiana]|uniref:Secreted protein n=1 Tax=Phyllosticta citriasiana TaxID=595635 RepID=A0ABR1KVV8_9PEZI
MWALAWLTGSSLVCLSVGQSRWLAFAIVDFTCSQSLSRRFFCSEKGKNPKPRMRMGLIELGHTGEMNDSDCPTAGHHVIEMLSTNNKQR